MKICASCNLQYEDERKFCRNCGKPLTAVEPSHPPLKASRSDPASGHCPDCGGEVAAGVKFCPNCGAAQAGSAPAKSGTPVQSTRPSQAATAEPESEKPPKQSKGAPPPPQKALDRQTAVFLAVCLAIAGGLIFFSYFKLTPRTGEQAVAVNQQSEPAATEVLPPVAQAQPLSDGPDSQAGQPEKLVQAARKAPPRVQVPATVVPETAIQPGVPPEPIQAPEPEPTPPVEIAEATPEPEPEPAPAPQPAPVVPSQLRNERVEVKLLQPLAASTNRKGDRFRTEVVSPADLRGAIIEGEITAAKAAGKVSGKSELAFSFDTLTVNSTTLPIRADLLELRNSQGSPQVDEEGHVIGKSSKAKDAVRTGIMAGVGAAIGGIFGGKKGAARGAAIGAVVGLTVTFSTRGEDIKLAPGAVLNLEVSTRTEETTRR